MRTPTWKEVKDKIEEELDLQEEQFISEIQLMNWYNDAIDICESHIHNLAEDWFLTYSTLNVSAQNPIVQLPENIYGTAIREINYYTPTEDYSLERIRDLKGIDTRNEDFTDDHYDYALFNSEATGHFIKLYPVPTRDYPTEFTINYIRNAKRLEYNIENRNDQTIDIPEFSKFCNQYVICKGHEKEKQWQSLANAKQDMKYFQDLMVQTLGKKVKDGQDIIEPDQGLIEDFSLQGGY